jgi:anthranilate synthase component 1
MDMAIAIRTMVLKQGIACMQAGGGIVYDSVPALEYEESMNKARVLLKAIAQAEQSGLNNQITGYNNQKISNDQNQKLV